MGDMLHGMFGLNGGVSKSWKNSVGGPHMLGVTWVFFCGELKGAFSLKWDQNGYNLPCDVLYLPNPPYQSYPPVYGQSSSL